MTHCEKLYNYFIEHPKASADEVMESFGWERRQVSRYKHRLKRRGFIDVDPCDGVQVLRSYRETVKRTIRAQSTITSRTHIVRRRTRVWIASMIRRQRSHK